MRFFFLLPFIIFGLSAYATDYYISATGNDANKGTTQSTPWRTIEKVNSTILKAGDKILFKRGDTFYGRIEGSNAGTSSLPITYGAYGTGKKPVITGFKTVQSWTNLGNNIWESTNAVSTLPILKTLIINGINTPMGRYPNGDVSYPYLPNFFMFQKITGGQPRSATTITSDSLTGSTNWAGADIVARINQWTLTKATITSQNGNTLSFLSGAHNAFTPDWGFFIQNDIRTLDQQNEWYYNSTTKKLSIYSITQPSNVQVTTIDTLFNQEKNSAPKAYTIIDNISFVGANNTGISFNGNEGSIVPTVTNCNVMYVGNIGINFRGLSIAIANYNNIEHCSEYGIWQSNGSNMTIIGNSIKNTGIVSAISPNDYEGGAIGINAANSLIQYNNIDSSYYCGIVFKGAGVQVLNNFINHSVVVKGDAAGIYTGYRNEKGKVIDGNIVLNSLGNPRGSKGNDHFAFGIYCDDLGNNMAITNNTAINCRTAGLYIHNSNNLTVRHNTLYNNGAIKSEIMWGNGGLTIDGNAREFSNTVHANVVTDNIIFALNQYQFALNYYAEDGGGNQVNNFGILDSNYYIKVNSPATAIKSQQIGINGAMSLSQWQSLSRQDAHSQEYPKEITNPNRLLFKYNATSSDSTISLDAGYIDVKGNVYDGHITLAPFSSAVLILLEPAVVPVSLINLKRYNLR